MQSGDIIDFRPDISVDEGADLGFSDADQHDRFVMLHQFRASERAVWRHADENIDRLSRVACCVDPIAVEPYESQCPRPRVGGCERRFALGWSEMIGSRHERRGVHLGEIVAEPVIGSRSRDERSEESCN